MKKIILAAVSILTLNAVNAFAADMPARVPVYAPPVVVAPFSWSGFYIGGHLGWLKAEKDWTQTSPAAFAPPIGFNGASFDANGFMGGGQVGFNFQSGAWVWGVE